MASLSPLPDAEVEDSNAKPTDRKRAGARPQSARGDAPAKPARSPAPKFPVATIFHEPWWLSAASDGAYEEAVYTADNVVIGRLPYLRQRKIGWQTALVMPTMTHVLGPSLSADVPSGERGRSLRRFTISSALIAQLPQAGHTWFALHRRETETLAFEAAGFSTGVRFTVEIQPSTPDRLWREMRDKTRNVIRRAQESLIPQAIDDPALFFEFYQENLRQRGIRNHYDLRIRTNMVAACLEHGRGRILVASDATGSPQAAIFTAWDDEAEYYLMSTRAPDSGNGAISLLIWTAIQDAAAAGRIFDLDGVDSRTNHMLLTGFGGTLRPRYLVSRTSTGFQVAQSLKTQMTKLRGLKTR
ncbi:GNAT family N-acetyltransferase [Acidisoma sp.]|uniref:GNAT family N-acetyltransferase n=1 Tax=Acidisoma sp. TaxID=1872115 RepID=UPI003B00F87B